MVQITEYRNAKSLSADNSILDLEINHPDYGWIPYTLNMSDEDTTVDNDKLKSIVDTMKVAEYVYPEVPQQDAEVADIIGSL